MQSKSHPLSRKHRILLVVTCAAALISTSGLVATTWIKSPAERRAEQAPPSASTLTTPVLRKILTTTVVLRGNVGPAKTLRVRPLSASLGAAQIVTVVTKKQGDSVVNGDVLIQISGRPIFALEGNTPMYRDLKPGSVGDDVRQLQVALKKLGYKIGDKAGTYGAGTGVAVSRLYQDRGLPANVIPAEGGTAVPGPTGGPQIPLGEVTFVPSFPAIVGSLSVGVGDTPDASTGVMRLDTGPLTATAVLAVGQQQLVRPGMQASLTNDSTQTSIAAHVTSVEPFLSPTPSAGGSANPVGAASQSNPLSSGFPLKVTPDMPIDPSWNGVNVRVTIIASSTTKPVLVVPSTAITTAADGTNSVAVIGVDQHRRQVQVTTGAVADGEVEVSVPEAGSLREGDLVVTG